MGGELSNLYHLFLDRNLVEDDVLSNVYPEVLKETIAQFLIQCPVYRYYGNKLPLDKTEASAIESILSEIAKSNPTLTAAVQLLRTALIDNPGEKDEAYNIRALRFYQRCMQFTGPLMAKGVEDTLMYTYNRFIGHNEVGDSPEAFGDIPEEFHQKMMDRQKKWPLSLNGTSTHDTKRGEDVRARLNVLTDIADEWLEVVKEWQRINKNLKETAAPDDNDEYLIYQTLIGAYPMPSQGDDDFENRIQEYLQKALREAKTHSNWAAPNEEYEEATKSFSVKLLDKESVFWKSFEPFHKKIADFGIINSLAQVLLKFMAPGVPDVYQGTELWDFSLVDPDNRRPVNFELRQQMKRELESPANKEQKSRLQELWQQRYSGQIKLWLVSTLLNYRRKNGSFFADADYLPLTVTGEYASHILAFARYHNSEWLIVAVPLHPALICKQQAKELLQIDWRNTNIVVPENAPTNYKHLFSEEEETFQQAIAVSQIFKSLPLAVLKLK